MMRFAATAVIVLLATGCGDDKASPTAPSPISNRAPQATGSIPDVTLNVNGAATTIDIAAHFSDPDGDTLSYSVSSTGDSVTVSISGSAVSLVPVRAGITMVTVVARDPGGLSAEQTFAVTVVESETATVTGVGFNATPPNGTDYRAGDRISIGIRFSKPVLWESGTLPTLAVAIGSHTRIATTYTGTLEARDFRSFAYVVRREDMDADGISIPVDALQGDIVDEAGVRADLSLGAHAVHNDPRQKVNEPGEPGTNRAPQATGSILDVTLILNGAATTIDIAAHFSDPDGDTLSYSVSSTGDSVTASISGSAVSLVPVRTGTAMITVSARDPGGLSAEQTFAVTVEESATESAWLTTVHSQYSIHYKEQYANDVRFVETWMDRTERLMRDKYGLPSHGYQMAVYLHPAPTSQAGVGLATNICCSGNAGEIHYLTPSAPEWEQARRAGRTTSLRTPYDDNYHAKTLVHEYITVAQERVTREKPRGFYYYSAPSWFVQGLEEYEGIFNSTETNRTTTSSRLFDYVDLNSFHCCPFGTSNVYNGGALAMKFLADQFGSAFHVDLLKSPQSTFEEALTQELANHGTTVPTMFDDFKRWFTRRGRP